MEKFPLLGSVQDFNDALGIETLHPLISVYDFEEMQPHRYGRRLYGLYAVYLKDMHCGITVYGRNRYDYQEGTLVFIGPGQVYGAEDDGQLHVAEKGRGLVFHPDLLLGTALGGRMKDYGFFSYDSNEALHMSERERAIILSCFATMREELEHPIDRHSRDIVVSHLEVFLNYCRRFYDRQFVTRREINHDVLTRFEALLDRYFEEQAAREGLPSVQYCAERLHLSPNYFGDLIKKETGRSAQEHIHQALIARAKELLVGSSQSVGEVSYALGFKYPQHLTRIFKQLTGHTPNEYRRLN